MSGLNIPESWTVTELGIISDYFNGRAFKTQEWGKKGLPIIRIQNLTNKRDGLEFNYYDGNYDERIFVTKGDLLFCWSGTLSVVRYDGPDALLNQHIFKVNVNKSILPDFYFHQIKHLINRIYEDAHGVGLIHITKEKLLKIPFLLPPIQEQNRIAKQINSNFLKIDKIRQKLDKTYKLLSLLRESYFQKLISHFDTVCLEELILSPPKNGYSPQPSDKPTKTKSLKLSATSSGQLDLSHIKYIKETIPPNSNYWLKDGDILIQRANSLNLIGATAMFRGPEKSFIYPDLMMKVNANEKTSQEYLTFCLQLAETQRYFQANASGAASNMPKINQTIVMNTPIPLANKGEQKLILEKVELFKKIIQEIETQLEQKKRTINFLYTSILAKAFTGQLVEQIPSEGTGHELLVKIIAEKESLQESKTELKTKKTVKKKASSKTDKVNGKGKNHGKK